MGKSLVIVESPAKARTLGKFLGKDFVIAASVGHVKDLPKSKLGVDLEKDFEPEYATIRGKGKIVTEIKKQAKEVDRVYLAPDPDREGEAIAYHIAQEILKGNKKMEIQRILFHEITKQAVLNAIENPLELDIKKFESQQARRILDRLVGYQISPILWDKVRRGLSAGRVQSVAVKIVVGREKAIRAFTPEEYWTMTAQVEGSQPPPFEAKLHKIDGKVDKLREQVGAERARDEVKAGALLLKKIVRKELKRNPQPPFITSRLQQESARRFSYTPKRTMGLAQRLYEGIDMGDEGPVGLITYMRTDSVRISDEALGLVRELIQERYGKEFLPKKPNTFKNRKRSQDAHEAIRPTYLHYPPEKVKPFLEKDQFKLYQLIWDRFVASQMTPAKFDQTTFQIEAGPEGRYELRTRGSIMRFPGFLKVYEEHTDSRNGNGKDTQLPDLAEGEKLKLLELDIKQNFTQHPPRFTEAALVKELEENGVGRPSTYAAILSTIQDKEYVRKEEGKLHPSETGEVVTGLLEESFPDIMDAQFTARMEENLDEVEEGKIQWRKLLGDFYGDFKGRVEAAKENMRDVKRMETPTDITCPDCKEHKMVIKWGRKGSFLGCSSYPGCRNTMEYFRDDKGEIVPIPPKILDEPCPKCKGDLVIKHGRFGRFVACTSNPDCDYTGAIKVGVKCPQEDCDGDLVEKRSKRGRYFFGCNKYPDCTYASWDRPVPIACPTCSFPHLGIRYRKDNPDVLVCSSCKSKFDREQLEGPKDEENKDEEKKTAEG